MAKDVGDWMKNVALVELSVCGQDVVNEYELNKQTTSLAEVIQKYLVIAFSDGYLAANDAEYGR